MSDLDQDRKSSQAPQPVHPGTAESSFEKLQRLFLSAFVHQQQQVRTQIDHAGRLSAVLSTQQEITSREPDLEEVLSLVSNRAISILGATGSAIALQRNGTMVCRASGGATGPALGAHLSAEFGLSGECLRTGQPVLCNDVDKDPRVDTMAAHSLGIRSLIVAPVFHHRTTVGVLEVFSSHPDFFNKEDAHIVELLGGMITTVISYSSEFEAKKTLQSERSAMLEVIEKITPTITRMLGQKSGPATVLQPPGQNDDLAGVRPVPPMGSAFHEEEFAESQGIDVGEDMLFPETPSVPQRPEFSPQSHESVQDDEIVGGHPDGDGELIPPAFTVEEEEALLPRRLRPDTAKNVPEDRERRAIDSAVEILLSKQHVLQPEPPQPIRAPDPAAVGTWASKRDAVETKSPAGENTASAAPEVEEYSWPEPEPPPLPQGSEAGEFVSDSERESNQKGPELEDWTLPALLQSRAPVVPHGAPSGVLIPSPASTADFFSLSHDLPSIPPAGSLPASKAVGAPSAPLGRSRGGMPITLRLRNLMEYVVPAALTGLLIVIGLQWLSGHQGFPALLGTRGLKAPSPSMFTAGSQGSPVEVTLIKFNAPTGANHAGKEISNRVSAIVAMDRSETAQDWSEGAKKLGKALTEKLPSLPSTNSDSGAGQSGPAISGLEKILPSNAFNSNPSRSAMPSKDESGGPVATVHLPAEVVDGYILLKVPPAYPAFARQNNITGTVVLNTVIARDGSVKEVHALSGNKYLAEAALDAVSKWRFKPFVLNSKPIEVGTEIRVAFTRKQSGQQPQVR